MSHTNFMHSCRVFAKIKITKRKKRTEEKGEGGEGMYTYTYIQYNTKEGGRKKKYEIK